MKKALLLLVLVLVSAVLFALLTGDEGDGRAGSDERPLAASEAKGERDLGEPATPREVEIQAGAAELVEARATPDDPRTSDPAGASRWIEGRVVRPAGTPGDERTFVVALAEPRDGRGLYGELGVARFAWGEGPRRDGFLGHVEVGADGRFRLRVPAERDVVHLAVTGRYLYSHETTKLGVDEGTFPEARLSAELGAWLTGKLSVPIDATGEDAVLEDREIELEIDAAGGLDTSRLALVGFDRSTETAADGTYEFRALPGAAAFAMMARHDAFAAHLERGLRFAAGEHRIVDAPLLHGATVRGRVIDETGAGIEGATVAVSLAGQLGQAYGDFRETETDASGGFELRGVLAGNFVVTAEKDGMRDARAPIEETLTDGAVVEGIELELARGKSITGLVRGVDGDPAPRVKVRVGIDFNALGGAAFAGGFDATDGGSTETEDDGTFVVSGLGDSVFRVVASQTIDDGTRALEYEASQGGVRGGDPPVELTLERLTGIAGRVESLDGAPVTDFRVIATLVGSGGVMGIGAKREQDSFEDAEDGVFELGGVSAGEWDVFVLAEGFGKPAEQRVSVPVTEDTDPLVFRLEPSASVRGVVHDPTGAPIAGAHVTLELTLAELMARRSRGDLPSATSDADGRFELEGVDPGPVSVFASHDDYAASEAVASTAVSADLGEEVELVLRVGGTLTGEVFGDDGKPAPGRMIVAQHGPADASPRIETSDAEGRFRYERMEPGSWQVVATRNTLDADSDPSNNDAAAILSELKMARADIVDGEATHVVLGQPPQDPVLVRGRVTHDGEPVSGAILSIVPEGASRFAGMKILSSDASGRFEAQLEGRGPLLISVQVMSDTTQQNTVEFRETIPDDAETFECELEMPLGRISGRVTNAKGEALEGCRVTLNVEGGMTYGSFVGGHYVETATGADGRYSIDYVRPGQYAVAAGGALLGGLLGNESPGGREVRSGLRVEDGQHLDRIDFELDAPGELIGVVVATDGKPAPEAAVFIRDEDGNLVERISLAETDASGRCRYRGLAPGLYSVSAKRGAEASVESAFVRVVAGEPVEARVTLEAGTMLIVEIVDDDDQEVHGQISVTDDAGHEVAGMLSMAQILESFDEGFSGESQRIGPLAPGSYTVIATLADGRTAKKSVSLTGRPDRKVKLRVR